MQKFPSGIVFALVGALAGGGVVFAGENKEAKENAAEHEEEDTPVQKKDIPASVMATAMPFSEGGELAKASLSNEDGIAVYEIVFKKGERHIEVQTTKAGDLVAVEEKINESKVPDLVRQRAAKLFKAGAKVTWEKTTVVMYEAAVKEGSKETEYLVNTPGAAFQEIAGGINEK